MTPRIIRTVVSVLLFLCFGIIQVYAQAVDFVNSTGDTLVHVEDNGNVGIGLTSPAAKLHVASNDFLVGDAAGNELSLSISGVDVKLGDIGGNQFGNYLFIDAEVSGTFQFMGGNLGIGTTSPVGLLHIQGDDTQEVRISGESSVPILHFRRTGNGADWILKHDTSKFHFQTEGAAGNEVLTLESDGNVGIGTTSPDAKLEVAGQVKITGGSPGANKVLTSDSNGLASWQNPSTATALADADNDTKIQVEESADEDKIRFDTGGSERMIIDNSGRVGIGTNDPGSYSSGSDDLVIENALGFSGITISAHPDRASSIRFTTTTASSVDLVPQILYFHNPADERMQFDVSSGSEAMRITGTGNVGIGTSNPKSKLTVFGYIQLKVSGSPPPATDCDEATELGRMIVNQITELLYICVNSGWISK